ncbi:MULTISPECIES: pyocin knob domain-containing protein [Lactococcus]|uniref:pyocin knob domain-containing protein n=1 Tax=Lactococcus TaxID=1357 RepID=UPI00204192D5|nr:MULTISPECIES: pyocin knob domain-containing protein [Lactococcus]
MTQTSFPWNDVDGDRLYDAEDFKRFFAAFLKTGVVMSFKEGLRVQSTQNGMNIQVGAGSGVINGLSYMNDEPIGIQVDVASSIQSRNDSVALRYDAGVRDAYLIYKSSDVTVIRNDTIFELQLAVINVPMNATQITDANITDKRSDPTVCGWSTPFDNINVDGIVDQYKSIFEQADIEFQTWFENMKDQLSEDAAGNLQNQINALNSSAVKITGDQTVSGNKTFTNNVSVKNLEVTDPFNADTASKPLSVPITATDDFNNLVVYGQYYKRNIATVANQPPGVSVHGHLEVLIGAGSEIMQRYSDWGTNNAVYTRRRDNAGNWGAWNGMPSWSAFGSIATSSAGWRRIGNEVTIRIVGGTTGNFPVITSAGTTIGTLPAEARPRESITIAASGRGAGVQAQLTIETDGRVIGNRWGGNDVYSQHSSNMMFSLFNTHRK